MEKGYSATDQRKLLNRNELAQALGVSSRVVTELTKEGLPVLYLGKVKRVQKGAAPRYDLEEVKAWLRKRTQLANQ